MKIQIRKEFFKPCLIAACIFLASCASQRPVTVYQAPSVRPVKEKVTSAQGHVTSAKSSAVNLAAATKEDCKTKEWQEAYTTLTNELDKAYLDLQGAQTKADELQVANNSLAESATKESIGRAQSENLERLTAYKYHRAKGLLAAGVGLIALAAFLKFGKGLLAIPYVGLAVGIGGPVAAAAAVIFLL